MISCSKCKKATLPVSDGGCIRTGGIVDIGCEYGELRILTNYDRLISKSPEELARWIWAVQSEIKHEDLFSTDGWYVWLMQEATE